MNVILSGCGDQLFLTTKNNAGTYIYDQAWVTLANTNLARSDDGLGLFRRKSAKEDKKSRTIYKETFKFKDGKELKMGRVRFGEAIPDAKRRSRANYFDD